MPQFASLSRCTVLGMFSVRYIQLPGPLRTVGACLAATIRKYRPGKACLRGKLSARVDQAHEHVRHEAARVGHVERGGDEKEMHDSSFPCICDGCDSRERESHLQHFSASAPQAPCT